MRVIVGKFRKQPGRCGLISASAGLLALATIATPLPAQNRETESAKVYAAVFEMLYTATSESPPVVIVGDSLEANSALSYGGRLSVKDSIGIGKATTADFEKVAYPRGHGRDESSLVGSRFQPFPLVIPVVHVTPTLRVELEQLGFDASNKQPEDWRRETAFWKGIARKYPRAWGLTTVTPIGFNKRRTEALLVVRHRCGMGCGSLEGVFLRKYAIGWRVAERLSVESFEIADIGQFRYLGADARFLAYRRAIEDSTRKAIADSTAQAALPRRIHGTAINRTTNVPITNAKVFLEHHQISEAGTIDRIFTSVVTDTAGSYEFINPQMGVNTLFLACPGSTIEQMKGLDMQVVYLFAGVDTTFGLSAPNIAPCWKTNRPSRFVSGWLESDEATTAKTPDENEAAIIAEIVENLKRRQGTGRIVGMMSHTAAACRYSARCGGNQLARLVHERAIDSSTVNSFRIKSSVSVPLNPRFATSVGLHEVTRDEVHYLAGAHAWWMFQPGHDSTNLWSGFTQVYGKNARILSVTRVGFNAAHTEALVEANVDSATHEWNDVATMMLLRRTASGWKVTNSDVGKGTTSGAWENGRCVAASPPASAVTNAAINALDGLYDLRFIATGGSDSGLLRVRIGHDLEPRWTPARVGQPKPSKLPFAYEVVDSTGAVDLIATFDLGLERIPKNIVRDPQLIQLDGFYRNMKILNVTKSGFYGSFVSGVFGDSSFGYFCAQKIRR